MDLSPIATDRLDLVLFTNELELALRAGERQEAQRIAGFFLPEDFFANESDLAFSSWKRAQVARDPSFAPWALRAVVLRSENVAVGSTNFHGPPGINDRGTPGAAEVGYTILPAYRGLGFATEVARGMLAWAEREHGVTHFISGVEPENLPSLRVNEKLGFVPTGEVIDGELIFELHSRSFGPPDQ